MTCFNVPSLSLNLLRGALWVRLALALVLTLGASFGVQVGAVESLTDSATAVADSMNENLANDSRTGVVTNEINANLTWVFWALWLVVPMLVYGFLIPTIILKAKANDMDSVKTGVISLVVGSVLYFGVLAMFFG